MGLFRKKKKKEEWKIQVADGVYLECPRTEEKGRRIWNCLPKGILVFLVVFGSMGGFISAFNIDCNFMISGAVLFLCALYFSGLFVFRKGRYKDLGYIIYFVFFVMGISSLKNYVNSGFAALVNAVRERGEIYFELDSTTEFAENIQNRYLTVTMVFIFVGMFEIILLNIFISNYMSLKLTMFVTLPIYIFALYFEREPEIPFMVCMIFGYAGIWILKNNGHYRDEQGGKGYCKRPGGRPAISFVQSNGIYRGILLFGLCFSVVIAGIMAVFSADDYKAYYVENKYKTATRESVSGFIMLGFRSFFPNMYARGGMSGGNLSNFSALRPGNMTHLTVRFTPYDTKPVYLKAYTGLQYASSRWLDGYELVGEERGQTSYFLTESMKWETEQLAKAYKEDHEEESKGVMEVINKGADRSYLYYPYFTKFRDYSIYSKVDGSASIRDGDGMIVSADTGAVRKYTYYPNLDYDVEVEDLVSYIYRDVPEQTTEAIDNFLRDGGISAGDADVVQKVVSHLQEVCSYSYSPGNPPEGEDFVNYFLEDNQKGVCAHFATSATLIFRRLGIPARYVEGYAFDYSAVLAGRVRKDLKYEDYYKGKSKLGKTAVMEIDVKDGNAHAWVEIYEEGRGWIVVDPTPSVMEESSARSFWSSLRESWENSPTVNLDDNFTGFNLGFLSWQNVGLVLYLMALAAACLFVLFRLGMAGYRWSCWHTKSRQRNILWYYRYVCHKRGKKDTAFRSLSMPSEQMAYLVEKKGSGSSAEVQGNMETLERLCFGPGEPGEEEYRSMMKFLRSLK